MTTMDETKTSINVIFFFNLRAPFCIFTFTSKFVIGFLNVHTRGKRKKERKKGK